MPKLTRLKNMPEAQIISQRELAKRAKITTRTAWNAVHGLSVSPETLAKIATALGVKPEKLL